MLIPGEVAGFGENSPGREWGTAKELACLRNREDAQRADASKHGGEKESCEQLGHTEHVGG